MPLGMRPRRSYRADERGNWTFRDLRGGKLRTATPVQSEGGCSRWTRASAVAGGERLTRRNTPYRNSGIALPIADRQQEHRTPDGRPSRPSLQSITATTTCHRATQNSIRTLTPAAGKRQNYIGPQCRLDRLLESHQSARMIGVAVGAAQAQTIQRPLSRFSRNGNRTRFRGTGMRWTLVVPITNGAESVRQRRVVLTSRCWRQAPGGNCFPGRDGGKRAVHRGEHVISRKAIAQGMSDVLRCPVCSCAHFLCTLRMRPRVQRASGIPCAL